MDSWIHLLTKKSQHTVFRVCLQIRQRAFISYYYCFVGKKKPYTTAKGEKGEADRHVSSQPIKFGNSYNLRKLNNLPYHRTKAGQLELLKKDCLCNFDFLLNKLTATSLW